MVCRVLFAGDFGSEREVVVNAARSSMGPVLMILFMLAGAVAARREPIEIAAIGVLGGLLACLGG